MNDRFVQIRGPFTVDENVVPSDNIVTKIGVQTKPTHKFEVTESSGLKNTFEMGKTEILELSNVQVTELSFLQDEPKSTIVDLIVI